MITFGLTHTQHIPPTMHKAFHFSNSCITEFTRWMPFIGNKKNRNSHCPPNANVMKWHSGTQESMQSRNYYRDSSEIRNQNQWRGWLRENKEGFLCSSVHWGNERFPEKEKRLQFCLSICSCAASAANKRIVTSASQLGPSFEMARFVPEIMSSKCLFCQFGGTEMDAVLKANVQNWLMRYLVNDSIHLIPNYVWLLWCSFKTKRKCNRINLTSK